MEKVIAPPPPPQFQLSDVSGLHRDSVCYPAGNESVRSN